MSAGGKTSMEGYAWYGMGPDVEDRLGALELNLTTLHEQHTKATGKLNERIRTLDEDLRSTRSAIDQREQQREQERQSSVRAGMRLQIAATLFFITGLFVSVWGGVSSC